MHPTATPLSLERPAALAAIAARPRLLVAGQLAHWRLRAAEIRGALTQHDLSAAPVDSLGREGDRVTWLGVFVNLALALAKFAAGALGRSAVMVADAAHSLSDLISDFVTLWAVRIARLGREVARSLGQEGNNFVKLEVITDSKYLLPDPVGTLAAARQLVDEGFAVLPRAAARGKHASGAHASTSVERRPR